MQCFYILFVSVCVTWVAYNSFEFFQIEVRNTSEVKVIAYLGETEARKRFSLLLLLFFSLLQ